MVEPISAIATKTAETTVSTKEVLAESFKESGETALKETPVKEVLPEIENSSLETLKAQNEVELNSIKEVKISQIELNRENGAFREENALTDLQKEFPENEGYKIEREQYLRDKDGNIVKDPETGEARRIDLVVHKDGKIVKSVEVTSETAPKELQIAKEKRIRENGGNYILDRDTGKLIEFPKNVTTEIRRYK
ncbi:MAG: hypothetical protein NZM09_12475 [Ignavibacterium sp.]|nr:hypothetical protein [Ignavibacterium sp.]MDW8376491.1 hypothetical protein [Ignavibacteriales bacterium]